MVQFVSDFNNKYFSFNIYHYLIRIILSFIFTFGLVGGVIIGLHPTVFILYGLYAFYIVHLKNDNKKWFLLASLSIVLFIITWSFLYENNVIMESINSSFQFILIFVSIVFNVIYGVSHFLNFGEKNDLKNIKKKKKTSKKGK